MRLVVLRHDERGDDLVPAAGGLPVAGDELADGQAPHAAALPCQLDLGIERHQIGNAVACGRGRADIADERAPVLHLDAADLARRALIALELRRKLCLGERAPGDERSDPRALGRLLDILQIGQHADVENVRVGELAPAGAGRARGIDVGAASQNGHIARSANG